LDTGEALFLFNYFFWYRYWFDIGYKTKLPLLVLFIVRCLLCVARLKNEKRRIYMYWSNNIPN